MAVADDKQYEIPHLLRDLFQVPQFKSRATHMGKIAHIGLEHMRYYQYNGLSLSTAQNTSLHIGNASEQEDAMIPRFHCFVRLQFSFKIANMKT